MFNFKAAAAIVGASSLALAGCGESGYAGQTVSVRPHYVIDPETGYCFNEKGSVTSQYYSHTWVPCSAKVIDKLPPELRQYADRTTGITSMPPAPAP